ncbi:hypothetical protein FHW92_002431 [Novosphingobium sp. SG707]|nr:hypothetical protein [Novosphingobium sp. SG707]
MVAVNHRESSDSDRFYDKMKFFQSQQSLFPQIGSIKNSYKFFYIIILYACCAELKINCPNFYALVFWIIHPKKLSFSIFNGYLMVNLEK